MDIHAAVLPIAKFVSTLSLEDTAAAEAALAKNFPSTALAPLREAVLANRATLAPRAATPTINFGRLSKAVPESHNQSIDVVDIAGAGAEHTHPEGEVSLCFAYEGDPRFDGRPEGWVVYGPDSHHTPTVTDGRMVILYFQPNGAVKWGPRG